MVHIAVRGRVQGVGYRAFVAREAIRRGIEGWVRNRRDGSVEAVLAGDEAAVTDLIAACRRGPFAAKVDALDQSPATGADLALRPPGDLFAVLATV